MRHRLLLLSAFLLLVLALAAPAPPAHARAGGGEGYSGGGGGGGGFIGGGGGGGGGFSGRSYRGSYDPHHRGPFDEMIQKHPFAFLLMVLVIIYLFNHFGSAGMTAYQGRVIVRGAGAQKASELAAALEALRGRDPGFDPDAFLTRVSAAFLKIQEAWSGEDMRPARPFLSDGVMERFTLQLGMNKALGIANRMAGVQVKEARLVQAASDRHFDTLHVSLRASAVDTEVSLKTGDTVRNSERRSEEFVEVWSFLRRPGTKTLRRPGAIEGQCPNCGAALGITDSAQCGACKSWVNSGQYDWTLAEITQACEWVARDPSRGIPGFAELSGEDPALNVQFLEDRASVAFWRWQAAHWERHAESLRPVAMETFIPSFHASRMGLGRCFKGAAVGGVEVLACEPGEPLDRVHVLVKWSGQELSLGPDGPVAEGHVLRHHVLVLARKRGVRTDPRAGLSSARCAACGASPSDRTSPRCAYCGADFNDGSRGWVLADVMYRARWTPPAVRPRPAPQPSPAAPGAAPAAAPPLAAPSPAEPPPVPPAAPEDWSVLLSPMDGLAILVAAMVADGVVEPRELEFARAHARKHSIPDDRIDKLMDAARRGALEVPRPKTPREAEAFLRCMSAMCLADGSVGPGETRTLLALGGRLGLDPKKIHALAAAERDLAYQRAKGALKARPHA